MCKKPSVSAVVPLCSNAQTWNIARTHKRADGDSRQTCRSALGSVNGVARIALSAVCPGALYTVGV